MQLTINLRGDAVQNAPKTSRMADARVSAARSLSGLRVGHDYPADQVFGPEVRNIKRTGPGTTEDNPIIYIEMGCNNGAWTNAIMEKAKEAGLHARCYCFEPQPHFTNGQAGVVAKGGAAERGPRWVGFAYGPGVVGQLTCRLAVELQLRAGVDERRERRAATVEAALALDLGPRGGPRAIDAQVCEGLRGLEAVVSVLWRLPLLNAHKEPIWRLGVWLLQPPAGVHAGVWAVVAALMVDAMERGRRHLWRITCPRDDVLPLPRAVAAERAGALATIDLWDALASFAEGGVVPLGWAAVVGSTHPFVGVVDGGLTLNKTS
ncbi:hypothetical protein FOA52_013075 [Chlamydomonas sp. UWO 241]|nr:hypothetical protein FOA52_013075 [Chlamydomonas sp. UWO 241]